MNVKVSAVHNLSKGNPCHGFCLDAVLDNGGWGFNEGKGGWLEGVLGEIIWDFAIGGFVYNVILLLLYFLQSRVGHDGLQAKTEWSPLGNFTRRKAAPLCCF